MTGVGGPVTAPVYSGTDVVGVLGFTTALAIQLCKFKWVPSGENRVVAQIYLGVGMTDFWTSLYQPSARRTGGTPVGGGDGE